MKVLILSLPRSYTKSIAQFLSDALGEPQLMIETSHKQRLNLGEILHFNECTYLGTDANGILQSAETKLDHWRPHFDGEVFRYVPCQKFKPVPYEYYNSVVRVMESTNKHVVAKLFPFKMYQTLGFTMQQQYLEFERLLRLFDVVLPVVRRSQADRISSSVTAAKFGWTQKDTQRIMAAGVKINRQQPTRSQLAFYTRIQDEFYELTQRYKLRVCHSEDLAGVDANGRSNAQRVLASYGISVGNTCLPENIEYSGIV